MQKVKKAFQKLKSKGIIEPGKPKASLFKYAWKLKSYHAKGGVFKITHLED
jgi:hypothetical protein